MAVLITKTLKRPKYVMVEEPISSRRLSLLAVSSFQLRITFKYMLQADFQLQLQFKNHILLLHW